MSVVKADTTSTFLPPTMKRGSLEKCSSAHLRIPLYASECSTTYVNSDYQRYLQAARHTDGKAQQRRVPGDAASLSLRNKDSMANMT